ncbi:MAG: hypothetical protein COV29_00560 [Candidatus Yanofskybacteria bacterium CG10_big_fil_rev_8_21_14_0_10_36_16]|uniref:Uncharacterized protein n=1 Tax=Candidatus Yanofskybacteria bacterium CG10_big_fil_rev_8_21_14_0_10_36_16 TaxID=1975096 RepID=A0A2J0Q8E6_9BACT|nr:MAG: hypothetical protein COV29_00560 [Candidatus Yanofskybacteria bacterium CG10_big_fil_rev_8_21_14_0_10_36_16]
MSEEVNQKNRKREIWKISGLEKRCKELVQQLLNQDGGLAKICQIINEEFHDKLAGSTMTQKVISSRLDELIWTPDVDKLLWRAVGNDMLSKFEETHPHIPKSIIRKRVKSKKGYTSNTSSSIVKFKAGMGRFASLDDLPEGLENYEFPDNSYSNPFVISEEPEGQVSIINGSLIGIKYPDIESNTTRRAFADARNRGAKAVIFVNILDLWSKKTAGPLAAYRAEVSGLEANPKRFPEEYREEVIDILRGNITDDLIYQTLEEKFNEIIDALHKISHRPRNKGPEFPGPVYIMFGLKEEELIRAASYYQCRYLKIVKEKKIEAELNMAKSRFSKARKDNDTSEIRHWDSEVMRLTRKKARTIQSNIHNRHYRYFNRKITAFVVKKFEEAIPNAKVISQGSAYFKLHKHIVKAHIPKHERVTDSLLASYGDSYGAEVFADTLADLTVICHPFALDHRLVGREDSIDGKPVTKFVAVAPSCLDDVFLRDEFRNNIREVHKVQKLVNNPMFKPGVLLLSWSNGILNTISLPISRLDKDRPFYNQNFAFPYPKTEYINVFLNTDNHFGAPDKRYIWDPAQKIHLGVTEAAIELMRREGVINAKDIGLHMTAEMDDATNGDMWFNPRYRPDPERMKILHFERWLLQMTSDLQRASEQGDHELVREITSDINRVSISQLYFRGEDFPFHQMMQVYERHIDPNVDFYSAVLERFVKSGLNIRGISDFHKSMVDTRDLAIHNFPNGNHRIKTLDQRDLEGDYIARHLQEKLAQLPFWQKYLKNNPDFLSKSIRAPRFGNETFGWGTVQAPDGYPWGMRVHGTPAKLSSWSDLLKSVIRNDLARGDDSYGLLKTATVTFYGDKHFYAKAEVNHLTYIMCAASVHTNMYGSSGGFPPNNTGVCFVSIPAGGPEEGPILVQMLPHDYLRDWFANPKSFNWNKFLPKAV